MWWLRFGVIWCIIKYRYPREAFNELEEDGCTVTERTKGVWEIAGPKVNFPVPDCGCRQSW